MSRASKALAVFFVASLGLWGCSQGPTNGPGSLERIRTLEAKHSKLEEEYRATAIVRDQLRKQTQEQEDQVQALQKERDDLRQQLAARTAERNTAQVQYEQFRNGIKDLLGRAEASLNPLAPTPPPPVTTTATAEPNKS